MFTFTFLMFPTFIISYCGSVALHGRRITATDQQHSATDLECNTTLLKMDKRKDANEITLHVL